MALKLFSGTANLAGSVASGDKVLVEDVSAGTVTYVPAQHLGALRTITNKTQASSVTLTQAEAGIVTIANTSTMTVNLPAAASSAGVTYTFIKTTADAQIITIDANSSETINGATTFTSLDAQHDSVTIACNGSAWYITAKNIA